jgi:WD40 repeat protein
LLAGLVFAIFSAVIVHRIRDHRRADRAILLWNYPKQLVIDTIASELVKVQPDTIRVNKWFRVRFTFPGGSISVKVTPNGRVCRIDFCGEQRALVDSLRRQILTAIERLVVPPAKRPQFSLRTLVIGGVLISSIIGLNWRWEPWVLQHRLESPGAYLLSLCFSPDGQRILTASRDGTARLWSAQDGHPINTLNGHTSSVRVACFSSAGQHVLTAGCDGSAIVWDANTGLLLATLKGHKVDMIGILDAAFTPNGEQALTTGVDGTIRIWKSTSGELLKTIQHGNGWVFAKYSSDATKVFSLGEDKTLRSWDANSGEPKGTLAEGVDAFDLSPDGSKLLVFSDLGATFIDIKSGSKSTPILVGPEPRATFSADGRLVALYCSDSWPVRILDVQTTKFVAKIHDDELGFYTVAFSARGDRLLTGSIGGAEIWDTAAGQRLSLIDDSQIDARLAAFMPDDERVIVSGLPGECLIYDPQRPDSAWGIVALPEFWLTLIFGGAFIWSLLRDRRELRAR